eukprot:jgi/Mesen1/1424/ME001303S00471
MGGAEAEEPVDASPQVEEEQEEPLDSSADAQDEPEAEAEAEEEEEDEPVDSKPEIEESCKPRCVKQLLAYEACAERIEKSDNEEAHCTGQYFDYWKCIDKCAANKIFARLK